MCFYVYAPNFKIDLEYVNEHIKIFPNGSSQIIAEIFIRNCSDLPLDKITLLYPNKFIGKWRNDEFAYYVSPSRFANLTNDFTQPLETCNRHYNKVPGKSCTFTDSLFIIKEPDPKNINNGATQMLVHTGKVTENVQIEVFPDNEFNYTETKICDGCKFTCITINFAPPISPSVTQAFKLYLHPIDTTHTNRKMFNKIIDRILKNELYYRIHSPHEVLSNLKANLNTLEEDLGSADSLPFHQDAMRPAIMQIKDKIFSRGVESTTTETIITDWRTSISFANGIEPITITESGQINKFSPFPDIFVSEKDIPIPMYQYYTGNRYFAAQNQLKYSIVVIAKPKGFLYNGRYK